MGLGGINRQLCLDGVVEEGVAMPYFRDLVIYVVRLGLFGWICGVIV